MKKTKSVFLSAISGNILEYYDFTAYAVFSIAIGKTFFPNASEFVQSLLTLATYAVGFVMRPIGGIFFGYIGDKYGRRVSLIISMLGMTVPTFTIGMIPSYHDIGMIAPITLIIMRLMQGLCISGEGAGAAIFILEHHQNLRPGLTCGIVHGSNIAGTLIATFIGILIEKYFSHIEFAWRFAFLLGGCMGLVGFYLRLRVSETPVFEMLAKKKQTLKAPFLHVVQTAWPYMFLTFCVGGVASSIVHLVKNVNVFYHSVLHLDNAIALNYLSYASLVMMITMPISGAIADRFGRTRTIKLATIAIFLLTLPTFIFMSFPGTISQITAITLLASLAGGISGTAYIFVISLFTPEQRFTGVAFSYNFGIAVFGGTSPMISRWLVEVTNSIYSPAFYIMSTAVLFLIVSYLMRSHLNNKISNNI